MEGRVVDFESVTPEAQLDLCSFGTGKFNLKVKDKNLKERDGLQFFQYQWFETW